MDVAHQTPHGPATAGLVVLMHFRACVIRDSPSIHFALVLRGHWAFENIE
jgi:hypothetical protein